MPERCPECDGEVCAPWCSYSLYSYDDRLDYDYLEEDEYR